MNTGEMHRQVGHVVAVGALANQTLEVRTRQAGMVMRLALCWNWHAGSGS